MRNGEIEQNLFLLNNSNILNNSKNNENLEFLVALENSKKNLKYFEKIDKIPALEKKKRILSVLRPKKIETMGYKNKINSEIGDILKKQDELLRRIQETDPNKKRKSKKFEDLYENRMKNFFSHAEISDLQKKLFDLKTGEKKVAKKIENSAESFVYNSIFELFIKIQ